MHQYLLTLSVLLLCVTYCLAADYYDVLGGQLLFLRVFWDPFPDSNINPVRRDASDAEIRKQYKKLSKRYHPDKNSEEGAKEKFVEIAHGAFT